MEKFHRQFLSEIRHLTSQLQQLLLQLAFNAAQHPHFGAGAKPGAPGSSDFLGRSESALRQGLLRKRLDGAGAPGVVDHLLDGFPGSFHLGAGDTQVIQLLLIPLVVVALTKAKLLPRRYAA